MVSGLDRTHTAIEAGANMFLNYDAWLRIGTVVSELISENKPAHAGNDPDRVATVEN
jgi:hypothetical protein